MNGAELDTEYHDWQEHAVAEGWAFGELCLRWSGQPLELECQRPAGHNGDHAATLGMDPDVNDWVTFYSLHGDTTERG